jgi:3-methylcrotonyl-CoA carboxylase alpha subunit
LLHKQQPTPTGIKAIDPWSPWQGNGAWRLNEPHVHRLNLLYHQQEYAVEIEQRGALYIACVAGRKTHLRGELVDDVVHFDVDGHRLQGTLASTADGFTLYLPEGACHFNQIMPDTGEADSNETNAGLSAPMNGTIVTLLVEPGIEVEAGTALLVMEAMKMEHTIKAPADGKVKIFYYAAGDLVDGGAELMEFTPSAEVV